MGIYIINTSNSSFVNITTNNNLANGIDLNQGSNYTLKNVNAQNDSIGVYLLRSGGNLLDNVTSSFNTYGGLFITDLLSGSNTLTNLTSNSNGKYGIAIDYFSTNNILTDSKVENNSIYGIYLNSSNNTIYNNLFNNTVNYYNWSVMAPRNYFNTTLQSGTNILGSSYIGGNFWDNWSAPGTGFSAACTDSDKNGICDSSYTSNDNVSIDYLPLYRDNLAPNVSIIYPVAGTAYSSVGSVTVINYSASDNYNLSSCWYSLNGGTNSSPDPTCSNFTGLTASEGSNTWTVYSEDIFGNVNSSSVIFTTPVPVTTSTSSGGTAPASGGGGGAVTPTENTTIPNATVVVYTGTINNVTKGVASVVNISSNSSDVAFTQFGITSKEDVQSATVTISRTNIPVSTSDLQVAGAGVTYQSFEINTSGINDSQIENVSIDFKVNKSWVSDNNLNLSSVILYRNPGTGWTPLNTSYDHEDSKYYYFSSLSSGFSTYTIYASLTEASTSGDSSVGVLKNFFADITPTFFRQTSWGYIFYYILVVLIVGGIVFVAYNLYQKSKQKKNKVLNR
jgi:PGF-pre-PGF domain-containing protein